ncbi:WD40 repeat-like protein [Umbelopsis sp. PMI_123]|nr:WD40 repeat-like protein [Umbelopsis sp. PMI_123]
MADNQGPGGVVNNLSRKQSADNAQNTFRPPPFPSSNPDHRCQEFVSPEGRYDLYHEILFDSLTPNYNIGTTASLVSIKYKESSKLDGLGNLYSNSSSTTTTSETVAASNSAESNDSEEDNANTLHPPSSVAIPSNSNGNKQMHVLRRKFSLTASASQESPNSLSSRQITSIEGGVGSNNQTSTLSFLTRGHTLSGNGKAPRKPKTSITKSNSSFVQRIITNDQLAKILIARTSDDTNLFYNCGTSFIWMDATGQPKEPLSRIIFARSYATVHDVNMLTRGADHLDIIIGFSTGDILWFDPLCNKYGRINKGGIINSSAVTAIKWLPGSENLFMAAFHDGCCMIFDKEREDIASFPLDSSATNGIGSGTTLVFNNPLAKPHTSSGFHQVKIEGIHEDLFLKVTKPHVRGAHKCNPVSHWSVSKKPIDAFAFSPDFQHVAVVGLDGRLRIIDYIGEKLLDTYQTYYGGLTCVAWSPDGRYILTGGQDDLVTIWAFREQRIVARCQGHSSWVTSVAFDSYRCDENVYRFGSVGEDAKLILWDFSVSALHRPKTQKQSRHRGASVSSFSNPVQSLGSGSYDKPPTLHPVLEKTRVAFLQPVMVQTIHADPCVGLYFREDVVVTTDRRGRVAVWKRPP